jgi:hypothetical protein
MLKNTLKELLGEKKVRTIPPDDYIKRLRSSLIGEGMLHEGNIFLMDQAIKNMPVGGSVVEIGCYGGLSTNLIIHLLKKHKRSEKFFGCDPWIYEGYEDHKGDPKPIYIDGRDDILRTDYMAYIKQNFIESTQTLSGKRLPHTCEMTSDVFFEKWEKKETVTDVFGQTAPLGGPVSFAYIDGNHAYDFARRDWQHVMQHLLPGGFILFDDSADGSAMGSAKLMEEVKKDPVLGVADTNPNYLYRRKT